MSRWGTVPPAPPPGLPAGLRSRAGRTGLARPPPKSPDDAYAAGTPAFRPAQGRELQPARQRLAVSARSLPSPPAPGPAVADRRAPTLAGAPAAGSETHAEPALPHSASPGADDVRARGPTEYRAHEASQI